MSLSKIINFCSSWNHQKSIGFLMFVREIKVNNFAYIPLISEVKFVGIWPKNQKLKERKIVKILANTLGLRNLNNLKFYVSVSKWWNQNTRSDFFVSKIFFIYLMTPADFANDQNTLGRVIWGCICTLMTKIYIKDKTCNIVIFTMSMFSVSLEVSSMLHHESVGRVQSKEC